MMNKGPLDWAGTRERAQAMSNMELDGALADILATLPNADAMDREDGGDRGGTYRDESSVLRMEREQRIAIGRMRNRPPACQQCGATTNTIHAMSSICADCEHANVTD